MQKTKLPSTNSSGTNSSGTKLSKQKSLTSFFTFVALFLFAMSFFSSAARALPLNGMSVVDLDANHQIDSLPVGDTWNKPMGAILNTLPKIKENLALYALSAVSQSQTTAQEGYTAVFNISFFATTYLDGKSNANGVRFLGVGPEAQYDQFAFSPKAATKESPLLGSYWIVQSGAENPMSATDTFIRGKQYTLYFAVKDNAANADKPFTADQSNEDNRIDFNVALYLAPEKILGVADVFVQDYVKLSYANLSSTNTVGLEATDEQKNLAIPEGYQLVKIFGKQASNLLNGLGQSPTEEVPLVLYTSFSPSGLYTEPKTIEEIGLQFINKDGLAVDYSLSEGFTTMPGEFWIVKSNTINSSQPRGLPLTPNAEIEGSENYTIFYVVSSTETANADTTSVANGLNKIANVSRILLPELTAFSTGGPYVAPNDKQGDPAFSDYKSYLALATKATISTFFVVNPSYFDTGFTGLIGDNSWALKLESDLKDVPVKEGETAKFVTYMQSFKVPENTEGIELEEGYFDLPAAVKGELLSADRNILGIVVLDTYTLVSNAAEAYESNSPYTFWLEKVASLATNNDNIQVEAVPVAKDGALESGASYILYYTAPIASNTNSVSNHTLFQAKLGYLSGTIDNIVQILPENGNLPSGGLDWNCQPGIGSQTDSITWKTHSSYAKDQTGFPEINTDFTGLGAVQFSVSGFQRDETFLAQRDFTYTGTEGADPLAIHPNNILLAKYTTTGGHIADFSPASTEQVYSNNFAGCYFIQKIDNVGTTGLVMSYGENRLAKMDGTENFEQGAKYRFFYAIANESTFDAASRDETSIADPNFLNIGPGVGAGSSSSSGCSVGENDVYDLALLLIVALGLMILRGRVRKS